MKFVKNKKKCSFSREYNSIILTLSRLNLFLNFNSFNSNSFCELSTQVNIAVNKLI